MPCASPADAFTGALAALAGKTVAVDPERAVSAIFATLAAGARIVEQRDPCVAQGDQEPTEQAGHRAAQARDGAAVTRFLHWLSVEAPGHRHRNERSELHQFRRECGDLRDLSFDTISGAGPNGAIVHYRVSEETNRKLEPSSVYLVDSGGQYPDGTTDITRTVWVGPGEAPAEERDRFTRVLKGHIALARAIFPARHGGQLDTLARQYLWAAGVDYAHGTGHGVGSFLAVHEGPQRIAKSGGQAGTGQALLPGMFLSNEPGKTGAYGMHPIDLVLVEERTSPARRAVFRLRNVDPCAHRRDLVDVALMDAGEAWWNDYHAKVWPSSPRSSRAHWNERAMRTCCKRAAEGLWPYCSVVHLVSRQGGTGMIGYVTLGTTIWLRRRVL
jgi:Xaa-Pro aminopeptidase